MKAFSWKEKTKIFLWSTETAAWHFALISKKRSSELRKKYGHLSRGFGSFPVHVSIGKTTWDTSIFYDGKSEQYMLPLKASVRRAEHIAHDDIIVCSFSLRM